MTEQPPEPEVARRRQALLTRVERLLFAVGTLCLGIVVYAIVDARWFAYRKGRELDQAITAARRAAAAPVAPATAAAQTDRLDTFHPPGAAVAAPLPVEEGSVLGRIDIPRLAVSDLVLEGIGATTLRRGVGHIPLTALPQQPGNMGLAGHRDTVFRALQEIRKDDLITLETPAGTYVYSVDWTRVVGPDDVSVLDPSAQPELTLVTCYPFYYVGSAPQRFIVRAHLLGG